LFVGGLLGIPFQASFKVHNGSGQDPLHGDSFIPLYFFVMKDLLQYIPTIVVAVALAGCVHLSRLGLLAVVGFKGFGGPLPFKGLLCLSSVGGWGVALGLFVAGTQVVSFHARVFEFGDAFVDVGLQANLAFYAIVLSYLLCDITTLYVYRDIVFCSRIRDALARPPSPSDSAHSPKRPTMLELCALALALVVLLVAHHTVAWTHTYGGAVGRLIHFQEDEAGVSWTVAGIVTSIMDKLLNPLRLDWGAFVMISILVVHVIAAPVVHAAVALHFGIRAWCGKVLLHPVSRAREMREVASCVPTTADAASRCAASGQPHQVAVWPRVLDTVSYWALVVSRMLSGADAFAAVMILIVPALGNELAMMTYRLCEPLGPAMEEIREDCYIMSSSYGPGLFLMLVSGLVIRILAERCAHGPLRDEDARSVLSSSSSEAARFC